ncbi:hypothetical protein CEXT_381601 [Caerostris extrusa]|uniref:Uncharacterized protein n=1 Tax=Caerostris extrusa TaxID=172846 RepID=A0AAV4WFU6_CAEEX|nr:hypothetical protein CEXT_381601 [Caerostris extrusa]
MHKLTCNDEHCFPIIARIITAEVTYRTRKSSQMNIPGVISHRQLSNYICCTPRLKNVSGGKKIIIISGKKRRNFYFDHKNSPPLPRREFLIWDNLKNEERPTPYFRKNSRIKRGFSAVFFSSCRSGSRMDFRWENKIKCILRGDLFWVGIPGLGRKSFPFSECAVVSLNYCPALFECVLGRKDIGLLFLFVFLFCLRRFRYPVFVFNLEGG